MHQLWAEFVYSQTVFGIWTNGKIVCLLMRVGNDIYASGNIDWTDPELLRILAGFCTFAIDYYSSQDDNYKIARMQWAIT